MKDEKVYKEYNEFVQGMIAAHEEWLKYLHDNTCNCEGECSFLNEFATEEDGSAVIDA